MSEPVQHPTAEANAAIAPTPPHLESHQSAPLALPAPPEQDADEAIKLDVGTGESVSLYDRLGPTVVNSDGTLSRIANWSEMTEHERNRILRVLGARNQIRLEAKKAELAGDSEEAGTAEATEGLP
ncbi:hypothetical protein JCM11251_000070 [Rhodosporidiobolus azoricus]